MKLKSTIGRNRNCAESCLRWIVAVAVVIPGMTPPPCSAESAARDFAREYTGVIGRYPIRMFLERHGSHVTGSYRYTRPGVSLRLEGTWQGSSARLQEIYGQRSRTGTIVARVRADGSLEGTWINREGTQPLSFLARPLSSTAQIDRTPAREVHRQEGVPAIKAHRAPVAASSRRIQRPSGGQESHEGASDLDADFLRAVQKGDTARARAMLNQNVRLNARDKDGRTALLLACRFRNDASEEASFSSIEDRQEFVKFLLGRGADPNVKDVRGNTPLMYATASWGAGNALLRLLSNAGADVNARNIYRGTALMVATGKYGNAGTVQLLLNSGADVNLRDKFGHTALWYAKSHHAPASVRVLEKAGAVE